MSYKLFDKILWIICLFFFWGPVSLRAQVSGQVTDAETGDPLPYVNVYFKGERTLGTTTDDKGHYELPAWNSKNDSLVFSYMGYSTHAAYVPKHSRMRIHVKLEPHDRQLNEIVVRSKKKRYKRKNNPAVDLMRKVIAAKSKSDLKDNDFYRYSKYQKITFAFNNITQEFLDSGFLRKFPLLVNQVEFCPQTQNLILPVTYNETASEHIYRKNPQKERDYIRGTRSEGFNDLFTTGDIATVVLQRFFTDVNVYDNSIYLLERPFTSPLSETGAIAFYQYYIMDTLEVDRDRCIEVSFVPQNPQDFGFSGRLWIMDDSTYRVKKCILNLPVRSGVNFISNMVVEQEFETLSNGQRILVKDNMLVELGALKKYHNMMIKRSTTYSGFDFSPIPETAFKEREVRREGSGAGCLDKKQLFNTFLLKKP